MKVIQRYITKNPAYVANAIVQDSRYATFQKRGPLGLVLHSVGAAQPKAENIAAYFDNASTEASAQAVLQADGSVLQLMPWNYRAWHVGGEANNTHVGIEMTEPGKDAIYYDRGYALHIVDAAKARAFVQKTYAVAVELFATLCKQYKLDPLKDGVILSHSECYKRGIGSNHGDPEHLWNAVGSGYTMNKFRKDVAEKLEELTMTQEVFNTMFQKALTQTTFNAMLQKAQPKIKTVKDVPKSLRAETQELIDLGVLKGTDSKGTLDLTLGELRCMIICLRMYKLNKYGD